MTKTITCPNCHTEMERVTLREWVAAWTGYCCPNGCCPATTEGTLEAEAPAPAKKKRGKKAATVAAVIEDVEVEDSDGC